ncbi:hypothetical protein D3C84_337170 [compost metagenome]
MVDRRVAVAHDAADAVEKLAFVIDLAGAVEVDLFVFVTAGLGFDLVGAFDLRTTADHVEHAAWRGLTVDRRGRAAQHGDALQVPGFDFRVGERALGQRQAVEELARVEAAHAQPVGTGVGAVAAALYAGGVSQGVIEVEHLAIIQLLAGDHAHRAGDFDDGGIGLGPGCGAGGHETGGRAPGAFAISDTNHSGFRQGQHALGHGHQAVGAGAALFQLQAGATQGLVQGAGGVELAVDRRRGFTGGQRRVQAQGQAGLAGDLVQGAGQWRGWQVVGANAGHLFGGDQHSAGQRHAEGNRHGQQAGAQQGV